MPPTSSRRPDVACRTSEDRGRPPQRPAALQQCERSTHRRPGAPLFPRGDPLRRTVEGVAARYLSGHGRGDPGVRAAPAMIPRRSALVLPIPIVIAGPPRTTKTHNQIVFIREAMPHLPARRIPQGLPLEGVAALVRDA